MRRNECVLFVLFKSPSGDPHPHPLTVTELLTKNGYVFERPSLQGVWELGLYSKMEDDGSDGGIGSESESSLLLLADELIDMVFSYSIIDHKDLCHCSQVCRRLNIIATGNELWKKKALSR